jgi:hypothetical protein
MAYEVTWNGAMGRAGVALTEGRGLGSSLTGYARLSPGLRS